MQAKRLLDHTQPDEAATSCCDLSSAEVSALGYGPCPRMAVSGNPVRLAAFFFRSDRSIGDAEEARSSASRLKGFVNAPWREAVPPLCQVPTHFRTGFRFHPRLPALAHLRLSASVSALSPAVSGARMFAASIASCIAFPAAK